MLAAAIRCGAQLIVTANLRDLPDTELAQFGIEALHPDEFVMHLFTLDGARVRQAISATAAAWRNPPGTPTDVCDRLAAAGLPMSAAALRRSESTMRPMWSDCSESCFRTDVSRPCFGIDI